MIGGIEMKQGSLEPKQLFLKIVGESGISVRDNRMRHAMKLEYIICETLSHYGCSEWVLKRKKMSIFGKTINYQHDDCYAPGYVMLGRNMNITEITNNITK
jgi:hypothetical protein